MKLPSGTGNPLAAFLLLKSNNPLKIHMKTPALRNNERLYAVRGNLDGDGVRPGGEDTMNPQGGTFSSPQLEELRQALPGAVAVGSAASAGSPDNVVGKRGENVVNILDPTWADEPTPKRGPKRGEQGDAASAKKPSWFGAPRLRGGHPSDPSTTSPRAFRQRVRSGEFASPTNGICPGYTQCNLVVLPRGREAFDFQLFCQRNKKACPLIEVCDGYSPEGVAECADLRTDVPRYAIYKNGVLEKEVTDATDYWPKDAVAFLIGCSFSYDGSLTEAGIPLRSVEQGKNVPMYRTNLKCRSAGAFRGNMVVSMKPIKALDIAKELEITSKYPHAHGAPVCVGCPSAIGIHDVSKPDWGDPADVMEDELPVFHACGVTPQSVLMNSKVPFAITHSAGHMFVTDLKSDVVV